MQIEKSTNPDGVQDPQTPERKKNKQSSDFLQSDYLAQASARRGSACESLRTSQDGK